MKLSRTAMYGVQAVVYVASKKGDIVIGHKAAKDLDLPEGFLLRIMVALSRAGVLRSMKGPNGGYTLARAPKDITLLHVVEAVEGPMVANVDGGENAVAKKVEKVLATTTDAVRKSYNSVKISELMK